MIRPAIEAELPELYSIYIRALASSKQPCGAAWNRGHFQTEFEQGKLWVSENEARLIQAFVFARHNGEAWEITQLATDPSYWKQAVMQTLLKHVLIELPAPIWLEVHEKNQPACQLYEKLGFERVGFRKAYYVDGGAAVLYSKT